MQQISRREKKKINIICNNKYYNTLTQFYGVVTLGLLLWIVLVATSQGHCRAEKNTMLAESEAK